MRIDATRFKAFLRSPEYYRLKYQCNLTKPQINLDYGLQRGTTFHLISECEFKNMADEDVQKELQDKVSDPKARKQGKLMHDAFKKHYAGSGPSIKAVEQEFLFTIPDSHHEMCGRIDQILDRSGVPWVGEMKTTNRKATYLSIKHQWRYDPQADFEILGARSLGHAVEGVLVRTVTEHIPPKVWEHEVVRSMEQLRVLQMNVIQVCDSIEMYLEKWGNQQPWPHNGWGYPCSMAGKCEFEHVCQQVKPKQSELSRLAARTEHLEIMGK